MAQKPAIAKTSTLEWTHEDVARMRGRWIHFTETMYGCCWLYGDPRGFRTRHHREHVEGDYKAPPPAGKYEARYRRSKASLKQPPVAVSPKLRPLVATWLRERLAKRGRELAVRTRLHHRRAYRYILNHEREGACIWDWSAERQKHLEAHR